MKDKQTCPAQSFNIRQDKMLKCEKTVIAPWQKWRTATEDCILLYITFRPDKILKQGLNTTNVLVSQDGLVYILQQKESLTHTFPTIQISIFLILYSAKTAAPGEYSSLIKIVLPFTSNPN